VELADDRSVRGREGDLHRVAGLALAQPEIRLALKPNPTTPGNSISTP
jgi:hypothetical protein